MGPEARSHIRNERVRRRNIHRRGAVTLKNMAKSQATAQMATPHVSSADRLGLMLFIAAGVHALIILGITFDAEDLFDPEHRRAPLEITLVHSRSDEAPEEADYLAQANQEGGGNVEEKVRPSSPFPNARPSADRGDAPRTRQATAPPEQPERDRPVISSETESPVKVERDPEISVPEQPVPEAAELVARSMEIARLSAEISERQQAYAQMPRHHYITANTREHVTAAYEEAWRQKVERVGNLNYPDEARRRNLSGLLVLDVAINADGTLHSTRVVRSSGEKLLDDGAIRIVRLAAPFAPFPEQVREQDIDVLHIIRAWQFQNDNSLSTHR